MKIILFNEDYFYPDKPESLKSEVFLSWGNHRRSQHILNLFLWSKMFFQWSKIQPDPWNCAEGSLGQSEENFGHFASDTELDEWAWTASHVEIVIQTEKYI